MPRDGNNNQEPNNGKQRGAKRKADQDQSQSLIGQPRRSVRAPKRRRGQQESPPLVVPDEMRVAAHCDNQGRETDAVMAHTPSDSQKPLASLPWSQAQSVQQRIVNAVTRITGDPDPTITFTFEVDGAMTLGQRRLTMLFGSGAHNARRVEGAPRRIERPPRPNAPRAPQLPTPRDPTPVARDAGPQIEKCGNCGRVGHMARACIKQTAVGDTACCVICNTKKHALDDCTEWQNMQPYGRFVTLVKSRPNMPLIRCGSADCFDLASRFPDVLEGYPWSRWFAREHYRKNPTLWQTYDYATKTPALPTDPATANLGVIRPNINLGGRYLTREQMAEARREPEQDLMNRASARRAALSNESDIRMPSPDRQYANPFTFAPRKTNTLPSAEKPASDGVDIAPGAQDSNRTDGYRPDTQVTAALASPPTAPAAPPDPR